MILRLLALVCILFPLLIDSFAPFGLIWCLVHVAILDVEEVTDAHFVDPNLDRANLGDLEEDSPYPEVRSAVANTDDPDMPANTIRVWILGMVMAIIIPGLNQFL